MLNFLKRAFLGEVKTYLDPQLGAFTTRIKASKPKAEYSWVCIHKSLHQSKALELLLEGSQHRPNERQMSAAKRLIGDIPDLLQQVKSLLIDSDEEELFKYKDGTYNLISVYYLDDDPVTFDLRFQTQEKDGSFSIYTEWTDGELSEINWDRG